ncbi:lysophospholipid acyltransferase family protein [Marinobacter sp. CHS3-4]|uniref:lysophospholipid acyltransferase family protein n=1 Tax=Marinobacter sp. CHS3-4 TaxID=3045174 RepID=UPI0024B62B44|nr:lysophospholipid acyltransferase family protein [Marinobacter sp. CHS3-4]MDI9243861.1 lysophospholipid acyltransferase family protein [Marinobacter sp. CHS3-4]
MNKPRESRHPSPSLWHPRYWLAWFCMGIVYLFSLLPFQSKQAFGEWLGNRLYRVAKSRAKVARQNLKACFPDWSAEHTDEVARQTFVEVSRGLMASVHLWSHPLFDVTSRTDYVGLEHLQQAQAKGKGVLLITAHYSLIELGFHLFLAPAERPGYMYRSNDHPVVDRMIERGRRHSHDNMTGFDKFQGKEMVAFLKNGGQVAYACDQDFNDKTKFFIPFLGVEAPCIDRPTHIAREAAVSVIFVSFYRTKNNRYRVDYSPIQEGFGKDAEADARAWNQYIEKTVRDRPEQYFWLHKRFKTRPEGSAPIY